MTEPERRPLGGDANGAPLAIEPDPPTTKLGKQLYEFVSNISMAAMFAGDDYCADLLASNASRLAHAWDSLAQKNARVREKLEILVSGGAWGEVVMATAPVALGIAQHHGLYPNDWPVPGLAMLDLPESPEVADHAEQQRPDGNGGDEPERPSA